MQQSVPQPSPAGGTPCCSGFGSDWLSYSSSAATGVK